MHLTATPPPLPYMPHHVLAGAYLILSALLAVTTVVSVFTTRGEGLSARIRNTDNRTRTYAGAALVALVVGIAWEDAQRETESGAR